MDKKSQQGIALIWMVVVATLLLVSIGAISSTLTPSPTIPSIPSPLPTQENIYQEEPLLNILPPRERAELESAIRETQQVLQNIEIFNFTPPNVNDITKGFGQINKQAQEQLQQNIQKQQQFQPPDINKMMEKLKQNPPAVPHEGEKEPSLEEQEYYYRKYILKDPAVQW